MKNGKIFKWRYVFFAFFALCMLMDWSIATGHPIHDGMTAQKSERLCFKALLAGPYAQNILPCLRDSAVSEGTLLFLASFLVLAAVLFVWRKPLYAWMSICTFLILWLGAEATGSDLIATVNYHTKETWQQQTE